MNSRTKLLLVTRLRINYYHHHHHYYSQQTYQQQQQEQQEQEHQINQLRLNQRLPPPIELKLIQTLSSNHNSNDNELLFQVLSKLSRYHNQERTTILLEHLLSHISIPSDIKLIDSLAQRIQQATNIEIFNDQFNQLAGKLFIRLSPHPSFEHVWEWYQLSKSRTAGGVLQPSLLAILQFRLELAQHPDRLDQLITDFNTLALITRSLSPIDLLRSIENLLWIAIRSQRSQLAQLALEDQLIKLIETQAEIKMEDMTMVELLPRLIALATNRQQAFTFYERLARLGRPSPRFFERLLRDYLALCESPRSADERPQALPMTRLMTILDHMKRVSIPIDGQTYAILLNHYSSIVRMNPRNLSTRLQLERIHTLIKLDINLEPDPHLVHQLFKAFSYNGLYDKAWAIWDQFFFSSCLPSRKSKRQLEGFSKISNPSFATMFDLAGFESERFGDGRLNLRAIDGWAFLVQRTLQPPSTEKINPADHTLQRPPACYLNKNLFDAWLECLCRSRRVEQALLLIFPSSDELISSLNLDDSSTEERESRIKIYPIIKPFIDQRTLSILLRFSKREDQLNSTNTFPALLPIVTKHIQSHFPQLWVHVEDQGRFN